MAVVINTFRRCLEGGPFDWQWIWLSALVGGFCFAGGLWFFRNRESRLADIL